jgi:anti-anti-sigma factor
MSVTERSPVPIIGRSFLALTGDAAAPRRGGVVMWLSGEHDQSTADALAETMTVAIGVAGAGLVVDLSGIAFMGAATLSVLLRAHEALQAEGRTLTLRSPSSCARRLLEVCNLEWLVSGRRPEPSRYATPA